VTRFVDSFLASTRTEEGKVSSNACTQLVMTLNKATEASQELKAVEGLVDLSNQYPYLPLGKPAIVKIVSLVNRDRDPNATAASTQGPFVRPCLQLLVNVTKHPTGGDPKETKAWRDNLTAFASVPEHVFLLMELVGEKDPYVQLHTVQLLSNVLSGKKERAQQVILSKPMAVNSLVALLDTSGEMVRNEALLLMQHLIDRNPTIQKIVAFNGVFDKVLGIAEAEGYLMGGIIVVDSLKLLGTLLLNNSSNQNLFVEGKCVARLIPLLHGGGRRAGSATREVLSDRKLNILKATLTVLGNLLTPNHRVSAPKDLCRTLLAIAANPDGIPAPVKAEALELVARLIDGRPRNQAILVATGITIVPVITDMAAHMRAGGGVEAAEEKRPALGFLLNLALGKDETTLSAVPTAVRSAALYALRCLFRKNFGGQAMVCQALARASVTPGASGGQPLEQFARALVGALRMTAQERSEVHYDLRSRLTFTTQAAAAAAAAAPGAPPAQNKAPATTARCPANVYVSQSTILACMRSNPMAKNALFAVPPSTGFPSATPSLSVFQRIVSDLLEWVQQPRASAGSLTVPHRDPREVAHPTYVGTSPAVSQMLLLIEGLEGSRVAMAQLWGLRGDAVAQHGSSAFDGLVQLAGAGCASKEDRAAVLIQGLACVALVVCLQHAVELSRSDAESKEMPKEDAMALHAALVRTVSTAMLPVEKLKNNLARLAESKELREAKQRTHDRRPASSRLQGETPQGSQTMEADLLDIEFAKRFEALSQRVDSLLLSLLTSSWASEAKSSARAPSQQTGTGGGDGAALEATREELRTERKRTATLTGQLGRAIEAVKKLEAKLRAVAAQNAARGGAHAAGNGGGKPSSPAADGEATRRIQDLEARMREQQTASAKLRSELDDAKAAATKSVMLEEKFKALTSEHEDLLVLLASEEIDKRHLLSTLEALRDENAALRRSGAAVGEPNGKASNGHVQNGSFKTPPRHPDPSTAAGHGVNSLPRTPASSRVRHGSVIVADMEGGTPVRERRDPIDQLP